MAITLNGHAPDLLGVSGDTKPDDALQNQLFLELDTATFYYFDGTEWQELGAADNNAKSTTPDTRELTKSAPEPEEEEKTEEPEPVEEIVEEPVKKTTTRTRKTTTTEG